MMKKLGVALLILTFGWFGRPAAAEKEAAAFYPVQPAESRLAVEVGDYLERVFGRYYQVLPPEQFEPVLKAAQASNPEVPLLNLYPSLGRNLKVRYVVSGRVSGDTRLEQVEVLVLEVATKRGRIFRTSGAAGERRAALARLGEDLRRYLILRRKLDLESERESDIVQAVDRKLMYRGPRPSASVAIDETGLPEGMYQLWAEKNFGYYLKTLGFTWHLGEGELLRSYARRRWAGSGQALPLTLASHFFVIGRAEALETIIHETGLVGSRAKLEVEVLDRLARVVDRRLIEVEAYGLSSGAAAVNALNIAASEAAIEILPGLRHP